MNTVEKSKLSVFDDRMSVRNRPNVTCGTNDENGMFSAIWEIIANSIDEAMVKRCSYIKVEVKADGKVIVTDDGCGVPMRAYHEEKGLYDHDIVFCTLYGSGKHDSELYKISGGLNGVGAAVANFSSEYMKVISRTDGIESSINYVEGVQVGELAVKETSEPNGTIIEFKPDLKVFKGATKQVLDLEMFFVPLLRQAMLTKGLKIEFGHPSIPAETGLVEFYFPNGVVDFFARNCESLIAPESKYYNESATGRDRADAEDYEVGMELTFNFSKTDSIEEVFHNCMSLTEGGVSRNNLEKAVADSFSTYAKNNGKLTDKDKFAWGDISPNMVVVLATTCQGNMTYFTGNTKRAINNKFIGDSVYKFTLQAILSWLINNKAQADKVLEIALLNKKAREDAAAVSKKVLANLKKGTKGLGNAIDGLEDCRKKGAGTSLYIVEGNSALGSVLLARNQLFQAIIAVRGKTLNCIKKRSLSEILLNQIVINIIRALGCGIECREPGMEDLPDFDISKMTYGDVKILTDADLDGDHITCLIISCLYRLVPSLFVNGLVSVVETPLFHINCGDKTLYAYNEQELAEVTSKLTCKYSITRSKGLGEDDAHVLAETAMNPDTRRETLVEFNPEFAEEVNKVFETLLGNDLSGRKAEIEAYIAETAHEGRIAM